MNRPTRIFILLAAALIGALATAIFLIYTAPAPFTARLIAILILAVVTVVAILFHYKKYALIKDRLKHFCNICINEPLYLYRRYTYACKQNDLLVAYNSVLDKLYLIKILEREKTLPYDESIPLNYYTVKFIEGEIRREDRIRLFKGVAEIVEPFENKIIRGKMIISYTEALENMEQAFNKLLRLVSKA